MSDQINQIAHRIADWARSINKNIDISKTCGYCMSGSWNCFYTRFLFPGKVLRDDRLSALVKRLREFGFDATLTVTPFENGTGLYMYMELRPRCKENSAKSPFFQDLWPNWAQMPASERVARIMAFRDGPKGLNALTKAWVDQNYASYAMYADGIVAELKK